MNISLNMELDFTFMWIVDISSIDSTVPVLQIHLDPNWEPWEVFTYVCIYYSSLEHNRQAHCLLQCTKHVLRSTFCRLCWVYVFSEYPSLYLQKKSLYCFYPVYFSSNFMLVLHSEWTSFHTFPANCIVKKRCTLTQITKAKTAQSLTFITFIYTLRLSDSLGRGAGLIRYIMQLFLLFASMPVTQVFQANRHGASRIPHKCHVEVYVLPYTL